MTAGNYVPVDYDQVGMLSNAVKVGETLRYFLTPPASSPKTGTPKNIERATQT